MAPPPGDPEQPDVALRAASDDGVGIATVGTGIFALALILCLFQRSELVTRGDQWWIWTCVSGVVVGLSFRAFASHRARAYRAQASAAGPAEDLGPDGH